MEQKDKKRPRQNYKSTFTHKAEPSQPSISCFQLHKPSLQPECPETDSLSRVRIILHTHLFLCLFGIFISSHQTDLCLPLLRLESWCTWIGSSPRTASCPLYMQCPPFSASPYLWFGTGMYRSDQTQTSLQSAPHSIAVLKSTEFKFYVNAFLLSVQRIQKNSGNFWGNILKHSLAGSLIYKVLMMFWSLESMKQLPLLQRIFLNNTLLLERARVFLITSLKVPNSFLLTTERWKTLYPDMKLIGMPR